MLTSDRVREIERFFRSYKANKRTLQNDYSIPVPSGIAYDKICVKKDASKNVTEFMTIESISRREELFKKVYVVDEVCRWFELEGHGRERFIKCFFIDGYSWVKTEIECGLSRGTLSYWRLEVLEKADLVGKWVGL